ncbi:MAG TPA: 2-dehydropantoate 2-reductase N-terminal domain-containing protein [Polyangiaceae bacterium]|jgi:2-dehydropantoate 2-reductase
MRVAIVGAGALGSVYGARLERFGGCEVSVVGRAPGPPGVERLERVEDGEVLRWQVPARVAVAPPEADVVVAFVRYEQLDALPARVGGTRAPVVVMTPMMPQDHARLAAALPGRLVTAMPSVVSYRNDAGAIRYWLPHVATTLIDARETGSSAAPEAELVKRLARASIAGKLEPDVLGRNVATTVSFIPLAMALDVAGSAEALLEDEALLALALDAADEGRELGRAVGKAEAWASMLLRFVGPFTLKVGVGLARSRAPEAVAYVEQHFGRKLHAQNVAMAERIVELAGERGTKREALGKLLARLKAA